MCQEGQPGYFRARLWAERITGLELLTGPCQRFPLFYSSRASIFTVAASNQILHLQKNRSGGREDFPPTEIIPGDPVPMEAEVVNRGSQQELRASLGARQKSSGGAAAVGLELLCQETWRDHGVARKKERFADEIGDILERKGSGFWDASCLKVSSLGLEVLRVQWVGDDTNQAGTSYQHPNLGRGTHKGLCHQQHL